MLLMFIYYFYYPIQILKPDVNCRLSVPFWLDKMFLAACSPFQRSGTHLFNQTTFQSDSEIEQAQSYVGSLATRSPGEEVCQKESAPLMWRDVDKAEAVHWVAPDRWRGKSTDALSALGRNGVVYIFESVFFYEIYEIYFFLYIFNP